MRTAFQPLSLGTVLGSAGPAAIVAGSGLFALVHVVGKGVLFYRLFMNRRQTACCLLHLGWVAR